MGRLMSELANTRAGVEYGVAFQRSRASHACCAAMTIFFAGGTNWYALAAVIFLMALVLVAWWLLERKGKRH